MSSALLSDVREGGSWTASQRAKNALIRWAIVLALAVVDRVPARLLLVVGSLVGKLAHFVLRGSRDRARAVAERVFDPVAAKRMVRSCFRRAGENLAVTLLLRRASTRALDWVEVDEATERTLGSVSGALAISAHLGAFELIPAVVTELGFSASVVVRESYDPLLDPIVDLHRRARGIEVIHRGRPHAALRSVRALREGRLLGILPDLGGRVPTTAVEFLGAKRLLPSGPVRLAARADAPMLLVVLEAGKTRRFRLRAEIIPVSKPEECMTQSVTCRIEKAILRSPEDWLWMAAPREIADSFASSLS
jgi:lauroyl/myristoyl acyltransferase